MLKVYICSPYASQGTIEENVEKAREYSRAAVLNELVPITPHIFFTQFMDDSVEWERQWALEMGLELIKECDFMWVFGTPTGGMIPEIEKAKMLGIPITYHYLNLNEKGCIQERGSSGKKHNSEIYR